jgi:hypothetical protein
MSDPRPLVDVQAVTWRQSKYARHGHGSIEFRLVCGHTMFAKGSSGYRKRKRCRECWLERINK